MEEELLMGHEKLSIYPLSIELIKWVSEDIARKLSRDPQIADQLARASSSIPLNIAEGSGKSTERDKRRFYSIARGSAMECSAIFDVMCARNLVTSEERKKARSLIRPIVGVLSKLCR
ncbi:MAG: four helix bundle protein [Bdellovibrionota bacterium]